MGTSTRSKDSHPRKACWPIVSRPRGNDGGDSLPHLQNAPSPMAFSPAGRSTRSSNPHLKNAYRPISLTESGIDTRRMLPFPLKAPLPIPTTSHVLPPMSTVRGIRTSEDAPEYLFTKASDTRYFLNERPLSTLSGGSGLFSGDTSSAIPATARLSRPVSPQILSIIADTTAPSVSDARARSSLGQKVLTYSTIEAYPAGIPMRTMEPLSGTLPPATRGRMTCLVSEASSATFRAERPEARLMSWIRPARPAPDGILESSLTVAWEALSASGSETAAAKSSGDAPEAVSTR